MGLLLNGLSLGEKEREELQAQHSRMILQIINRTILPNEQGL